VPINDDDNLRHVGVLGMHWGQHKAEESGGGGRSRSGSSKPSGSESSKKDNIFDPKKSTVEKNAAILKKNPNAAVVNYGALKKSKLTPEQLDARNKKIRNIAIGVGLGLTVLAGGVLYAKNKKAVDGAIGGFLQKFGKKKVSDLPTASNLADKILDKASSPISEKEASIFKQLGIKKIKTQQDAVAANFVTAWLGHDANRFAAISDDAYNALDDADVVIKSGQQIKRVTKITNEVLRDGAYVSFDPDDVNRYNAFLPALWKVNSGGASAKVYEMSMEAVHDIKSPSAKKRIDVFADLLRTDTDFQSHFMGFSARHDDPMDFAKKNYNILASGLVDHDSAVTKTYIEEIKRRGYNALIDDNDAGRLAKSPLILLDSKSVLQKGQTELTREHRLEALNKINPMAGESLATTVDVLTSPSPENEIYKMFGMKTPSSKEFFDTYYDALTRPPF
jgi:hypothetical protein